MQFSTGASPSVEFCSTDAMTAPDAPMVNCTMMRPPRAGFLVSCCS
jgi:hypothetical protein